MILILCSNDPVTCMVMLHVCHILRMFLIDGEMGPPNIAVDQQRNRIIATAALKNADPLADQGQSHYSFIFIRESRVMKYLYTYITRGM